MTNQIQQKGHTLIRFKWIDLDGKVWDSVQPASWLAKFAETRRCFDFKAVGLAYGGCEDEECWCNDTD